MSVLVRNNIGGGKPKVTLLHHSGGRSRTQSYTFENDYKAVIIAVGGYGTQSISSGNGWVADGSAGGSSTGMAYSWHKYDVKSGESVTLSLGDRNGMTIYGIN